MPCRKMMQEANDSVTLILCMCSAASLIYCLKQSLFYNVQTYL